ncbi:hypothetical protein T265_04844 [Opisthorchis viverrini]|uniref:Phosphatidylserine synthase n=1 Tax=Opisthorchis viverrini TaxID=6198 RepID=A0A074ZYC3_OPIVI|nr:hypothetical protein T265_04844 [Opisthorchis viverrini]KER28315.1 hypothetical protein T265_04844 [Opisthorchis viverrini]
MNSRFEIWRRFERPAGSSSRLVLSDAANCFPLKMRRRLFSESQIEKDYFLSNIEQHKVENITISAFYQSRSLTVLACIWLGLAAVACYRKADGDQPDEEQRVPVLRVIVLRDGLEVKSSLFDKSVKTAMRFLQATSMEAAMLPSIEEGRVKKGRPSTPIAQRLTVIVDAFNTMEILLKPKSQCCSKGTYCAQPHQESDSIAILPAPSGQTGPLQPSFNVCTLCQIGLQTSLAETLLSLPIDVCFVFEARIQDPTLVGLLKPFRTIPDVPHFTLLASGDPDVVDRGIYGVVVALSLEAENVLLDWIPVSSRLCAVRLSDPIKINVAYAPTGSSSETEKDEFYQNLSRLLRSARRMDILILVGDMNAQVGRLISEEAQLDDPFGVDAERTDNGKRLLQLCADRRLLLASTNSHTNAHIRLLGGHLPQDSRGLIWIMWLSVTNGKLQLRIVFPSGGPFTRPHPAVWRVVFGASLFYFFALVLTVFLRLEEARQIIIWLYPELKYMKHSHILDKEYAVNCSQVTFERVYSHMDIFALAHFAGWVVKTILLRHRMIAWTLSINWEITEIAFSHILPNFNECWWDSLLLDVLICNGLGIEVGMLLCRWLEIRDYRWDSIRDIRGARGKLKRAVLQFTPGSWTYTRWLHRDSSVLRSFLLSQLIIVWQLAELNSFFLKHVFIVKPSHPLTQLRLLLITLMSAPAIRKKSSERPCDSAQRSTKKRLTRRFKDNRDI